MKPSGFRKPLNDTLVPWLKQLFEYQLGYGHMLGDDREAFLATVAMENLRRIRYAVFAVCVLNVVGAVVVGLQLGGAALPADFYHSLFRLYCVNALCCLGVFAVLVLLSKRNLVQAKHARVLFLLLVVGFHILGIVFTINGQGYLNQITSYLLALAFCAVAFSMQFLPSLALHAGSWLLLFFLLSMTQDDRLLQNAQVGNSLFAALISFVLSRVTWAVRVRDRLQRNTIARQVETIRKERRRANVLQIAGDFQLSLREREILALVLDGKSNKEIALELDIQVDTAKKHISSILRKTKTGNRFDLARQVDTHEATRGLQD